MKTFPLLQSQMSIWLGWIVHPTSTAWNLPSVLTFPPHTDAHRLYAAVCRLAAQRSELHIRFTIANDGQPRQYVDAALPVPVSMMTMTEDEVERHLTTSFVRPFAPLGNEALCRFELVATPRRLLLLLDIHHSIADGITVARNLVGRDIPSLYAATGTEHSPTPSPSGTIGIPLLPSVSTDVPPLFTAATNECDAIQSPRYRQAREAVLHKLADTPFTTLAAHTGEPWGKAVMTVEHLSATDIDTWCQREGTSPQILFATALGITLSKLCREKKVAFFTLTHGRNTHRQREAYGMYVNSLPVVLTIDATASVGATLAQCRREFTTALRQRIYPATHCCRDMRRAPAITFGFQSHDIQETTIAHDMRIEGRQLLPHQVNHDLNCVVYLRHGHYELRVDSSEALNPLSVVQLVARAVKVCTEGMMRDEQATIGSLPLTTEAEQQSLLQLGRGETMHYDTSISWLHLFSRQVQCRPEAIALVCTDGTLTYAELNRQADAYADTLRTKQTKNASPFVCIEAQRSTAFMVQVVGAMKAGKAYVPIDPAWPETRQQYIRNEAEHTDNSTAQPENSATSTSALAYMMYTSGSTGEPKGVMVSHRALLNLTLFVIKHWRLNSLSRIACHSPLTFDASVEDLFPVLAAGGTLYLIPDDIRTSLKALTAYLHTNGITGGCYTTRFGVMLLQHYAPEVDYLCLGGEKLMTLPPCRGRLINTYGPTECTVDATYCQLDTSRHYADIPIGRPLDNLSAFVVDAHDQLLPRGAVGELWLTGPQVAEGYWRDKAMTEEHFGICPYNGQRMFRTGDLVRWNTDGLLEFVGRADRQVKVRGYRIEPVEVERAMLRIAGVQQAVVVASPYSERLTAYFTADEGVDENKVGQTLRHTLPAYMVPCGIIRVDSIPLNANGKADVAQLPRPTAAGQQKFVAPTTSGERELCKLFGKVLDIEQVSVEADFFDLGGTSLTAMMLVEEAERCGLTISYQDVFTCSTPRQLASMATEHITQQPTPIRIHPTPKNSQPAIPTTAPATDNQANTSATPSSVLLTGATGFLGVHVLHALLQQSQAHIVCLVRQKDKFSAAVRMQQHYEKHFHMPLPERVSVLPGDIADPLTLHNYREAIDVVVHCAADTRHFARATEIESVNIGGTAHVIAFCLAHRSRLIHISTTSLSPAAASPFSSDALPYLRTKRGAERLVATARAEQGLQGMVLRIGNLVADDFDGTLPTHTTGNAFIGLLQLLQRLGMCSARLAQLNIDCSEVSRVAKAIVNYTLSPQSSAADDLPITLLMAPPIPLRQLIESMNRLGAHISIVDDDTFRTALQQEKYNSYEAYMLYESLHHVTHPEEEKGQSPA